MPYENKRLQEEYKTWSHFPNSASLEARQPPSMDTAVTSKSSQNILIKCRNYIAEYSVDTTKGMITFTITFRRCKIWMIVVVQVFTRSTIGYWWLITVTNIFHSPWNFKTLGGRKLHSNSNTLGGHRLLENRYDLQSWKSNSVGSEISAAAKKFRSILAKNNSKLYFIGWKNTPWWTSCTEWHL